MTYNEAQELDHGLYRVFWKEGGDSLCAVGSKHNGERWICCTNWTSAKNKATDCYGIEIWEKVDRVELIVHGSDRTLPDQDEPAP